MLAARGIVKSGSKYPVKFVPVLSTDGRSLTPKGFCDREKFFSAVDAGRDDVRLALPFDRIFLNNIVRFGAVANRDIAKGEIVCEYRGSVVSSSAELEKRETQYLQEGRPSASYTVNRVILWDAYRTYEGDDIPVEQNPGVWLNNSCPIHHHAGADAKNCKVRQARVERRLRLYLVALRDIPRLDELIHDYHNSDMLVRILHNIYYTETPK